MNTLGKKSLSLLGGLALLGAAAVQAGELGAGLTPFGAEQAGNAEGSIPAWTGKLAQMPAGWKLRDADPLAGRSRCTPSTPATWRSMPRSCRPARRR
ncbi:MAG: hypothetical protein ACRERY_07655 [Pseudomonas sp.]